MKNLKLYIAHNFHDRHKIRKIELRIEADFKIELDNPFYDNDRNDIEALDKLPEGGEEQKAYFRERNTKEMCESIVEGDLDMIRKADGLFTIITAASIGTSMEIIWAARVLRMPVYIVTKNYYYHPWIQKHATRRFKTLREFRQFLTEMGLKRK